MNELIVKLAEQAGELSVEIDNELNLEIESEDKSYTVPAAFIEKFSELLLNEVITNVKSWERDSRNHISYMLKNHFGVL